MAAVDPELLEEALSPLDMLFDETDLEEGQEMEFPMVMEEGEWA